MYGARITSIFIFEPTPEAYDADGYPTGDLRNILGAGNAFNVDWQDAKGGDIRTAAELNAAELPTITMRYYPGIDAACKIFLPGDPRAFDILSVENVGMRNVTLKIKAKRGVRTV